MAQEKSMTSVQRLDLMETRVEGIEKSISNVEESSSKIFTLLEQLTTKETPIAPKAVVQAEKPEIYHLSTSGLDSRVISTNIEKVEDKSKGCFDILTAVMDQFPNKVTVSAPHIKKDGTMGKSYILNLPRIDETFNLVNKKDTTLAQQKKEATSLWKRVAFNGYCFTGMYRQKGAGSVYTTYILARNEEPFLKFLAKKGVHIPKKDAHKPKSEGKTS